MLCCKKNCSVADIREERLTCAGFCERSYHLSCVGFPDSASTRLRTGTGKPKDHYICSTCSDNQKAIAILLETQFRKMMDTMEKSNQQMMNSSRAFANQDHVVDEISKQLDQLANDVKHLSKHVQKLEPQSGNVGVSIDEAVLLQKFEKVNEILKDVVGKQSNLDARIKALTNSQLVMKNTVDDMQAGLNLEEIKEKTNIVYTQSSESALLMANLRDDITILLERNSKSPAPAQDTNCDQSLEGSPNECDGWRTFSSGRRIWKQKWVNGPSAVVEKHGSFRYTNVKESKFAFKEPKVFHRRSSHRRTTNQSAALPANPRDLDQLDQIIEEFESSDDYPNFVRAKSTVRRKNGRNMDQDERMYSMTNAPKFNIDPLKPPIVQLTERNSGGRYMLARLRDNQILEAIRLYLAYLYDKKPDICVDGQSCVSVRTFLASEGLPIELNDLQKLYHDYHRELGLSVADVNSDLTAYGSQIKWKRIREIDLQNKQFKKNYGAHSNKHFF